MSASKTGCTFSQPAVPVFPLQTATKDITGNCAVAPEYSNEASVTLPSCQLPPPAPTNLAASCNAAGNQATLSWNAAPGATKYQLRVDNTTNNISSCLDGWFCTDPPDKIVNDYTPTSYTASVVPNQPYRWWVHSSNDGGNSAPTGGGNFTCAGSQPPNGGGGGCTDPLICPNPPSNPTADKLSSDTSFFCPSHQVQLSWSYSDPNGNPQSSFKIEVDDNADFSSPAINVTQDSSNNIFITPPTVLNLGKTYNWKVAVKDSTGEWSNWSSVAQFTTPSACAVADFDLLSSNSVYLTILKEKEGDSNTATISVVPRNDFDGDVKLEVFSTTPDAGSPTLPSTSTFVLLPPTTLDKNHYSGTEFYIHLGLPGVTDPGTYRYTIVIKGSSGSLVHYVPIEFNLIIKLPGWIET